MLVLIQLYIMLRWVWEGRKVFGYSKVFLTYSPAKKAKFPTAVFQHFTYLTLFKQFTRIFYNSRNRYIGQTFINVLAVKALSWTLKCGAHKLIYSLVHHNVIFVILHEILHKELLILSILKFYHLCSSLQNKSAKNILPCGHVFSSVTWTSPVKKKKNHV